jgi:hypothetical protein
MSIHALLALDQRDGKLREFIQELTNQRDEARREVCYAEINGQYGKRYTLQDIAKIKGWDCFKSDKQ